MSMLKCKQFLHKKKLRMGNFCGSVRLLSVFDIPQYKLEYIFICLVFLLHFYAHLGEQTNTDTALNNSHHGPTFYFIPLLFFEKLFEYARTETKHWKKKKKTRRKIQHEYVGKACRITEMLDTYLLFLRLCYICINQYFLLNLGENIDS